MKIAIVGGGIGGLTLAYYLCQNPQNKVFLFEKNKNFGGLLGLLEIKGASLEGFYHHLFKTDREIISLIKRLGLKNKLLYLQSKVGVYYQGRIYPFSSPLDLLRFSPLSFGERIRCGLSIFYLQKFINEGNWQKYREVSASCWLKRFCGERVYEVIWKPLLYGKFGQKAEKISLAWLWQRIYLRSRSRKKFGLWEELVYLKGGFKTLVTSILRSIEGRGGVLQTKVSISKVKTQKSKIQLKAQNFSEFFDKVVVTTPIPLFLQITEGLPENYVRRLEKIKYRAALCLVLFLKKQLMKDIYWLNIHNLCMPLLSVVEHTNFVHKKFYGGEHIVYVGNYLPWKSPFLKMRKEELFEVVVSELKKINPKFEKKWVKRYFLFKDLYAQPVVDVHYHKYIPPYQTPIENLYLMTMAQVYPQDRGMNQAVREAKRLADVIMRQIK